MLHVHADMKYLLFLATVALVDETEQVHLSGTCIHIYMYIHMYMYMCIHVQQLFITIVLQCFDKLIWCTIGSKRFLFGTAQFSLWA